MELAALKTVLTECDKSKDYDSMAISGREALGTIVDYIYEKEKVKKPKNATLLELIDSPVISNYFQDEDIVSSLHYVRILGANASNGRAIRKKQAKLTQDNLSLALDFVAAKENGTEASFAKPKYITEAATRKMYVDLYLQEAGWDILDEENVAVPGKAGIEIEVQGMPNEHKIGYCDYVLYGRDNKPLAIVEVKKTSINPETGRHQVDLYGECMKAKYGYKPILYYTNGYETKIIDGVYPDRKVLAFHSLDDLERLYLQRTRGRITDITINENISGRPYQKMAITKICERFDSNRRKALLVMATGTGKTRVSISLVDVLARNKWIKNILFLADRTNLVDQAKRNFVKLLPNLSCCVLSSNKGEKNLSARMIFSTYQTMIKYIDAEDKEFSIGRFDLIILDEAHRSIFNRYGSIFKYFDSLLVGLTATPKDDVDTNTYRIFDCESGVPNFEYGLEEAIKDKYLVGYTAISRTSDLIENGIKIDQLSSDELEQLDEYFEEDPPTPDFNIPGNELFKYLFNKETCRKVLEDLMTKGLKVNSGETIGKSIIFAYNHQHAQMIVECFHEMYPEYPANTCQLIDYSVKYSDDLVLKFDTDDEFRIAVSVDKLDTGVDVPSVLNLVFFKKIRSKVKFVQMIGRGTRLCEDLYGPGKSKSEFLIIDYCANFEYFNEHPQGKDGKETMSISQRIFQLKLDILYELRKVEFQEDPWFKQYFDSIKAELIKMVKAIRKHSYHIQVRENMNYVDMYSDESTWIALSPVMIKEMKNHLTSLLEGGNSGDYLALNFDARIYIIELSILRNGSIKGVNEHIKNLRLIAQYLLEEKATIPQVLAKATLLRKAKSSEFWDNPTVPELEDLRLGLRDLMQFLKNSGRKRFEIDIHDSIEDSEYQPDSTVIDIRTYREKVIDYLAEHFDIPAVKKIYNIEQIQNSDLDELEEILWHILGTPDDYKATTGNQNMAAFVRSLIGLSQEAVNEKFGKYLNENFFNSDQQEFIKSIIDYVRENGDIERQDLIESEPFSDYDLTDLFGTSIPELVGIVDTLHESITLQNFS